VFERPGVRADAANQANLGAPQAAIGKARAPMTFTTLNFGDTANASRVSPRLSRFFLR
jgi:hypothetical protein